MMKKEELSDNNNNNLKEDIDQDQNNIKIMDYLVEKLSFRYNKVKKFSKLLSSSDSLENLYSLRIEMKSLFSDLAEDLRQGIFAIKALADQNKRILADLDSKEIENKKINDHLNELIFENKNLKFQLIKVKESKISHTNLNNYNNKMNKMNLNNNQNNNNKKDNNIIREENKLQKNSRSSSKEGLNKKKRKCEKEKEIDNLKKNNYEFEQLSNVKNIIDKMKFNKIRLKMAIEQHFINKENKDENNIDNDNENMNYFYIDNNKFDNTNNYINDE